MDLYIELPCVFMYCRALCCSKIYSTHISSSQWQHIRTNNGLYRKFCDQQKEKLFSIGTPKDSHQLLLCVNCSVNTVVPLHADLTLKPGQTVQKMDARSLFDAGSLIGAGSIIK